MTKKLVLKLEVCCEKDRKKAMKTVSSLEGIESLAMDMKEKKLTVIGDVDPVEVVRKLRKSWCTQLLTVGPAKEPEKKGGGEKKDGDKDKKSTEAEKIEELIELYKKQYPRYIHYYPVYSAEENPNSCFIC